jgi:uncharacterized membrane protein YdjX (TVP38/TMEM64 family)
MNRHKYIGIGLWVIVLSAYFAYSYLNNVTPLQTVRQLIELMSGSVWGPLIYMLLYLLRPLLFFSATLLTVAAGYLFGPVLGVLYTIVASNASSMVAYGLGRYLGAGLLHEAGGAALISQYSERMRRNSFEAVLTMRFLFLPYDLVSYLSGFLKINWRGFLTATVLGSIPGTISFVLFGAGIQGNFGEQLPTLDVRTLALGGLMFITSLAFARYLRRRESQR